jgi:hypothetical protein
MPAATPAAASSLIATPGAAVLADPQERIGRADDGRSRARSREPEQREVADRIEIQDERRAGRGDRPCAAVGIV